MQNSGGLVPARIGSWLTEGAGPVPKLVWRVKLVAELEPGMATETEVARQPAEPCLQRAKFIAPG
jgi:hypothetical protein